MESRQQFLLWRGRVFWTLWVTYAAYYVCRTNISFAIPQIIKQHGFSETQLGWVGTGFFVAYAVGQLINGQLVDRFGGRALILVGIAASVALNVGFGFTHTLAAMIALWLLNGYAQSTGWSATIKTLANWHRQDERGRASGVMGASYQVGNVVAWALAGGVVVAWGWRWVFWAPAAIFAAAGVLAFARLRNSPESMGLGTIEGAAANGEVRLGWRYSLAQSLGNPKVWVVAFTFFFMHTVRYGLVLWVPTYLERGLGLPPLRATWMAVGVPLAAAVGAVFAGWATDRFWGGRRAPLIVFLMLALSAAALVIAYLPAGSTAALLGCLLVAGAAFGGADILLVGTLAMDIASRKGAGAAVGFIDAMGYMGAAITGVGAGWLAQHYGWSAPFLAWGVAAFLGAPLMATLWRYRPEPREYM